MNTTARAGTTAAPSRARRTGVPVALVSALMVAPSFSASALAADEPAATGTEPQFWSDVLSVGDCIIRPAEGELPVPLSCDELHGEEIYAIGSLDLGPDAPYPGDEIFDLVDEQLCDEATTEFGGETWDLLPFTTFWLYPLESEWEAGDRGIICAAAPPDGIDMKIGTAAGGILDSDDVLLARGGFSVPELGEISEWVAVEEGDTISSVGVIGDGRFDVARRRAWAVPQGFMFNAIARGDELPATTTWGYTWDTGEFTDLGSIFPGWELSSTMVMNDNTVFAARETPDDDGR